MPSLTVRPLLAVAIAVVKPPTFIRRETDASKWSPRPCKPV